MRPLLPVLGAVLLVALSVPVAPADDGARPAAGPATRAVAASTSAPKAFTIKDPRITESSGLAASRIHPGVYWTHNDSDDGPYLYAVDSRTGKTVATVTMTGVGKPRDVEAISLGPDGNLYVGDIGDNLDGSWPYVWIYRLPEPRKLHDVTVRATQFTVKYADGPRNAEALMVHPKTGRVYIADKKSEGGSLYEGPAELSASGTNVFKKIAATGLWVTDGAFSPDGEHLALRGYFGGVLFDWKHGGPKRHGRLGVPMQGQGESVTYTPDGSALMYGSEGANSPVTPGSTGDSDSPSADGGSGGGSGVGDTDDLGPGYKTGGVVLVVALVVLFGANRLLRRRGERR